MNYCQHSRTLDDRKQQHAQAQIDRPNARGGTRVGDGALVSDILTIFRGRSRKDGLESQKRDDARSRCPPAYRRARRGDP